MTEEFKINCFVSMVTKCKHVALPYFSMHQGLSAQFDKMKIEQWPLIQAYALEGYGRWDCMLKWHKCELQGWVGVWNHKGVSRWILFKSIRIQNSRFLFGRLNSILMLVAINNYLSFAAEHFSLLSMMSLMSPQLYLRSTSSLMWCLLRSFLLRFVQLWPGVDQLNAMRYIFIYRIAEW